MRLSEAILLGTIDSVGRLRGVFFDAAGQRCALGDALHAVGKLPKRKEDGFFVVSALWPWTKADAAYPCQCELDQHASYTTRYIIGHLNDKHIVGDGDWTLEQLVDYVRSIEPAEDNDLTRLDQSEVEMPDKLSEKVSAKVGQP